MKTIAVDVDGVVADLAREWLARYNKDYNDSMTIDQWTDWGIHKLIKPECGIKIYEYIEDPKIYDDVLPYEGAIEGVKWLAQFYRVIFVTNSTLGASGAKYNWLKSYGFISRLEDYVECKDKSLVRAEILIDDKIQNLWDFYGKGILYIQPWNENKPWYGFRLSNWKDFNAR